MMANKKETDYTMDLADGGEEAAEAPKTMKIKITDFRRKLEPGTAITLYGISFTAMKNGNLVANALTAVAQAGIDAGLYKKA